MLEFDIQGDIDSILEFDIIDSLTDDGRHANNSVFEDGTADRETYGSGSEPTRLNDGTVRKTVRKTVCKTVRWRSRQIGQLNLFLFGGFVSR